MTLYPSAFLYTLRIEHKKGVYTIWIYRMENSIVTSTATYFSKSVYAFNTSVNIFIIPFTSQH